MNRLCTQCLHVGSPRPTLTQCLLAAAALVLLPLGIARPILVLAALGLFATALSRRGRCRKCGSAALVAPGSPAARRLLESSTSARRR